MTDEVAFQLGKFDFPHFYHLAQWKLNKEPFPLFRFFDWHFPGGLGGTPCKKINGPDGEEYVVDWESMTIGGMLKLDTIKDISHKLNYIRGRLTSYSVKVGKNKITICYANSHAFRDFTAKCLAEVILDKFNVIFPDPSLHYKITCGETIGTIPATPYVELEASEEIIKYIVGQ